MSVYTLTLLQTLAWNLCHQYFICTALLLSFLLSHGQPSLWLAKYCKCGWLSYWLQAFISGSNLVQTWASFCWKWKDIGQWLTQLAEVRQAQRSKLSSKTCCYLLNRLLPLLIYWLFRLYVMVIVLYCVGFLAHLTLLTNHHRQYYFQK